MPTTWRDLIWSCPLPEITTTDQRVLNEAFRGPEGRDCYNAIMDARAIMAEHQSGPDFLAWLKRRGFSPPPGAAVPEINRVAQAQPRTKTPPGP